MKTLAKFPIGQIVATPGAVEVLDKTREALVFLSRHMTCDWGEVCDHDKKLNDEALKHGDRLLSAYTTSLGDKVWIITEADRSVTTILLPSEY